MMKSFRRVFLSAFAVAALLAMGCDDGDGKKCTDGEKQCKSASVAQLCVNGKWEDNDCGDGSGCDATSKTCEAIVANCENDSVSCANGVLTTCVKGSKPVTENCDHGCNETNDACNAASTKCSEAYTKCENGKLTTCVEGEDPDVENCASGECEDESSCKEVEKCSEDYTKCENGKLTTCVEGEDPDVENCASGECEDASSCKAVVVEKCTEAYSRCADGVLKVCVEGQDETRTPCADGCNEANDGCAEGGSEEDVCTKTRLPQDAVVEGACDPDKDTHAGNCSADKSKWFSCNNQGKITVRHCFNDCTTGQDDPDNDNDDGGCGFTKCTSTYESTPTENACANANENACNEDKKGGKYCTSGKFTEVTCKAGFSCVMDGTFVNCEKSAD
ncbi:MAG: hypothetical protein ACOX8U_06380 [Bradymonadia bacterium]|jgi:hypothetical protein